MIKELTWDSAFFGKKIGKVTFETRKKVKIYNAIADARNSGFAYLTCKIPSIDYPVINSLMSAGFYLTDIGLTFTINIRDFFDGHAIGSGFDKSMRVATLQDLPDLQRISAGIFTDSRFYHDPFFSRKEADCLYQAWIENSVKGEAADIVMHIPRRGFIACKKSGDQSGDIPLVGVGKRFRGRGIGRALISQAMRWFQEDNIHRVTVRTQVTNLPAVHFYLRMGFFPMAFDMVLGNILEIRK